MQEALSRIHTVQVCDATAGEERANVDNKKSEAANTKRMQY